MNKQKIESIKKFGFEFLTIFISIFAAFALDNWNENRKDQHTEIKILTEINKGLSQDLKDISENMHGHENGLKASKYFIKLILKKENKTDSLYFNYFELLRDFISVQNNSGYETLKSKGLEIIENDSLRTEIISLYENDYNSLRKLEENYAELQLFQNYKNNFDNFIVGNFIINQNGELDGINLQKLTDKERKILLMDLSRIYTNRDFIIRNYNEVKSKIVKLQERIDKELKK